MSGTAGAQVNAITQGIQQNPPLTVGGIIQDVQGLQSTKNQILQNMDLNRTLQAKQAYAQALKDNVNPDGSVNIQGLQDAAQNNPALAYALPSMLPQEQGQNLSAQDLKVKMLGNATARAGLLSNVVGGTLLAKGADITQDDVTQAAKTLLNEDPGDPILEHDVTAALAGMGNLQGPSLASYVNNIVKMSQDSLAQLQTQLGGTQFQQLGGQLDQTAPNTYGQVAPTGETLGETMSPGQAASGVTMASPGPTPQFPNNPPAGTQIIVPQAQVSQMQGLGYLVPGGGVQAPGGGSAPSGFNPANPASVQAAVAGPGGAPPPAGTGGGGAEGIQAGPTPQQTAVVGANAATAGTTLQTANNELSSGLKSLNMTKMAADLAQGLQTRPGKSSLINLAGNLQKYSGGLISQKVVDAIIGGSDPNATPQEQSDAQAAAQTLVKVVAGNIAQQYQANGGQNLEFLNQVEQGNADVNKLPQLFKSLETIQANNMAYDQQLNDFYTQNAGKSNNLVGDFAKYAQTVGLTPDNGTSWKDQNTVNGQSFNTLLQDSLANPSKFPNAVALANKLQAHPGVPIQIAGGKMAVYDPTTGTYAIKAQ